MSDSRALDDKRSEEPTAGVALEGAKLALRSKYLAAIVGLMAFYEIGSQVNDYQFFEVLKSLKGVFDTQLFMTNVSFYANSLAVVVQLFFVSLIMKRWGATAALLFFRWLSFSARLAFSLSRSAHGWILVIFPTTD